MNYLYKKKHKQINKVIKRVFLNKEVRSHEMNRQLKF